jgi:hypothetical protein
MRITLTLKLLLLLTVLPPMTFAQRRQTPTPPAQLTFIVEKMERAQAQVKIPNHVKRDYRLSHANSATVDSEVIAEIDFRAPGNYTIEKHSGSSLGAQLVKRVLEHEVAMAVSSQKSRSAAVTRENYLFGYLGEAVLDGQSYYLLRLDPKRKQPELIAGQAWVDKQSFLIRRIEGNVKSPSVWVKKIHIRFDFNFDNPREMWVLANMEAVADVRFLGARKLTSQVLDYETASVVAKKIGAVAPSASALLLRK